MVDKKKFLKKVERMLDPSLVTIHEDAIMAINIGKLPDLGFQEPAPVSARSALDVIRFALAMNSINHQFWDTVSGKFERYEHGGLTGALAMRAGLVAMMDDHGGICAIQERLPIDEKLVRKYFGAMPDSESRARALTEAFGSKGDACARLLLDSARDGEIWGVAHAQAIATLLPLGFGDEFLKKAQLCMWMAKGMLEAREMPAPEVELTCFADYQVPKVLRGLGVLSYERKLAAKVDSHCVLESDGAYEKAIRAATIVACEKISVAKGLSAPELDYWLWSRRHDFKAPFHLVRTMKY